MTVESGADGLGWSDREVTRAGSAGFVHGPWGNEVLEVSKTFRLPTDATQCIVSWKSWAANTRDGEHDRVEIDGRVVWDHASHYGDCEEGWQPGPPDFPNAGEGGVCFFDATVIVPCSGAMLVTFTR